MPLEYYSPPYRRLARWPLALAALTALAGLAVLAYNHPSVYYRVQVLRGEVRSRLRPPPEMLPTAAAPLAAPTIVLPTIAPTPTQSASPEPSPTSGEASALSTPEPTATPLGLITDLPDAVKLAGFQHEYQKWNNCGPATLSVTLSYWGWQGTQADTAAYLKPSQDDRNVPPREMYEYIRQIGYDAYIRVGGDIETIKRLLVNGFPVMAEKGFWVDEKHGWMGHYVLVSGYDDNAGVLITQDTYRGPNVSVKYADFVKDWRAFNYVYLVVYPPERDSEVRALLGAQSDDYQNWRHALDVAYADVAATAAMDHAFAWFNVGTNLDVLGDAAGAAAAYDQARQAGLPWRMLWYQTGMYRTYFNVGRYQEVIDLATNTLANAGTSLEESLYWRGQARVMLGDVDGAVADYREALKFNPNFTAAAVELSRLGVSP